MVRFYDLNAAWALTLPFSAAFYLIATMDSALKYWTGRGGEWKGRAQDQAESESRSPPTPPAQILSVVRISFEQPVQRADQRRM